MNVIIRLIVGMVFFLGLGNNGLQPAFAQELSPNPVISLSVKEEPLIDVLDDITEQTGYRFELSEEWESHPISANVKDLPLERGLKRILKNLNHTILWGEDNVVNIRVYGKATQSDSGGISFAAPPQDDIQEENDESPDEVDESQPAEEEEQPPPFNRPDHKRPGKGGKPPTPPEALPELPERIE